MANVDDSLYPIATASAVSGLTLHTGRAWVKDKWLRLLEAKGDRPAHVAGATTLLSARRVLQMAIAAKLAAIGMHPQKACEAAFCFTDLSAANEAPGFDRDPGELFTGNTLTFLVAGPGRKTQIIRSGGYKRPDGKIEKPTIESLLARDGCWVLMLDPIVKHVEQSLEKFDRGEVIG